MGLLLTSGFLGSGNPAGAVGTSAGTSISNTATATYTDPNNPGQTLNATSNTVAVTVAEVAGITNTGAGVTDTTGGASILPGHTLRFDFLITNVGNDPTDFFIPGAAAIVGPITLAASNAYQYSIDGGLTYVNIPAAGVTTPAFAPGGTVRVRVVVTVNPDATSGATISVQLGDTPPNNNSAATQNQPSTGLPTDVRTVDAPDGSAAGETPGAPVNGEREASALESVLVGATPQAFAAILKTRTGFTGGVDAQHDLVTYGLTVRVDSTSPSGASPSLVPADLAATTVKVDGSPVSRVLVSDAIPTLTVLAAPPTTPAGWQVVYTTTPVTTVANNASTAWTTTIPGGGITTTTRIGFISPGPVARGTTVSGFSIQVLTSGASLAGSTTIANIAQLFGQTVGDATNKLIYDESGDQLASNFNDDGSPGSNVPTSGLANPATDGVDNNNNNTGAGVGGEDNTFTIGPPGTILNGPNGQPTAVGPTDNNDDFTNQSAPVPPNTPPGTPGNPTRIDPATVTFTNTISNASGATETNILLVPTNPANVPGGSAADLPNGTTVTLTYGANTAVYTYNSATGNFAFTSGTAIQIPSLPAGATVSYTAVVDLPAGTAISTDTGRGYPVPIRAFVDTNSSGTFDVGEPYNITVDREFVGFLQLVKAVEILDTDGITVIQGFTTTPTSANIRPGRFIVYQITYTNITNAPAGSGNILLNATNVAITEDGTALPNNWARDNDGNGAIDTSNVVGSAVDSGPSSTIAFYSGSPPSAAAGPDQTGTTAATDVTKYVVSVTAPIPPTTTRTFTFKRKVN